MFFIAHSLFLNFDYFIINSLSSKKNFIIYIKLFNLLSDKFIAVIGIVFIFTMIQFLFSKNEDKIDKMIDGRIFKKISKNSFFIYLIHQPIILVILKGIRNIPIQPIIVYNILFWSTLIISFEVAEIFSKFASITKVSGYSRNILK